jgi:hypothetical protein
MDRSIQPPVYQQGDAIAAFVDQTAALIELPILPEHRSGVIESFSRITQVAALVLEFPLPESFELDFIFQP